MEHFTVKDIQTEIVKIALAFYGNVNIEMNWNPEIGQLKNIIEIVEFIFENYRLKFDEIIKRETEKTITEEKLNTERILIVSWISLEVLNELKKTENEIDWIEFHYNVDILKDSK